MSGPIEIDSVLGTDLGDRSVWARSLVGAKAKKGKLVPAKLDLETAITNISITDTISGSSTIVLSLDDEQWELVDSGFFDADEDGRLDAFDVNYPEDSRFWWRCTQIGIDANGSSAQVEMTFMERAACHMMQHHGPLKTSRSKRTRAEFIKSLSDQVKAGGGITFHSKQLHVKQTMGGGESGSLGALGAATGRILDEGDSLAEGSKSKLHELNPKVTTQAAVGRTSSQGLANLRSSGHLPPNLVVQLGTNDTDLSTFRSNVKAVLKLSGVKRVFWVNISRPSLGGTSAAELNAILNDEAQGNAKLFVIDWKQAVDSGKAQLGSDNIHATASGYDYRARMIADALRGKDPASTEDAPNKAKSKTADEKKADKDKGFAPGVKFDIRGVPANKSQIKQLERALNVAEHEKASERATLAMICAAIGESAVSAVVNSIGYGGVFQGDVSHRYRYFKKDDTEEQAHYFLVGGKGFQGGGAIKLAKQGMDIGEIVTTVEGSGEAPNFYGRYLGEAKAILKAWGGATDDAGGGGEYRKQYNFEVGSSEDPHEDFYAAATRLAEEVKWAFFFDGQELYYDPETSLISQKPAAVIRRGDASLVSFSANWDTRKIATECSMDLVCDPFEFRAGEVFQIEGFGPASTGSTAGLPGRWLIAEITRERFSLVSSFSLKQPVNPSPEPPSDTAQRKEDEVDTETTEKGTATFDGKKIAAWIKPILEYARKHGWKGRVNSGYRTFAEQTRIYNSGVRPAAKPGTSNHEGSEFPRGAVDVSDAPQLSAILLKSKYAERLVWAGAKDPPHFSHPHGGSY